MNMYKYTQSILPGCAFCLIGVLVVCPKACQRFICPARSLEGHMEGIMVCSMIVDLTIDEADGIGVHRKKYVYIPGPGPGPGPRALICTGAH